MSVSTTPAYIGTVEEGHTVSVPNEVPVGTKVAILLLPLAAVPDTIEEQEAARAERFSSVLAAIRSAIAAGYTAPALPDEELDARIRRARRQKPD